MAQVTEGLIGLSRKADLSKELILQSKAKNKNGKHRMILTVYLEATPRFELGNQGFADPCLTTWLCRLISVSLDLGKKDA